MTTREQTRGPKTGRWLRQPSWWIVVLAGSLLVFFLVAIVREVIHGYTVRQQVARLRQQVTSEEQRQKELKDLLDYLASPTFQERQARINLGLKKSGERVVVVPPQAQTNTQTSAEMSGRNVRGPSAWWAYFLGTPPTSSS